MRLKDAPRFSFHQLMSFARIDVFCVHVSKKQTEWCADCKIYFSVCPVAGYGHGRRVFIQFRDTSFSFFVAHLCGEHSGKYLLTWHFGLFSAQVKPPMGKNRVQCLLFGCQRAPCHFLPEHMVLLRHSHRGRQRVKGGC